MVSNKKILLTGGSGMVGSNIVELANMKGLKVFKPDRKTLNLLSSWDTEKYINKLKPDVVVHVAGKVGGIQANIKEPFEFLFANSSMAINLISACKKSNVKKFLNVGTTCMYPKDISVALKENMILTAPLEPTNEGYALAKVLSLKLCEYISKNDKTMFYKTIIPCNLYGKFDSFDNNKSHLIPAIIKKIHNAKMEGHVEVEIWGSGEARREFMFASDLADAILKAISDLEKLPDVMNIGVGSDRTIREYYETVAKVMNWDGKFCNNLGYPEGMKRKLADISLQEKWGWKPKYSLEEGIKETYEYFLETI